jgi:thioredoxin reductase
MESGYHVAGRNGDVRMGLKKLAEKMAEYNARLEQGKVEKIEPDHVKKVLKKLKKKTADLEAEIAATGNEDKKVRLNTKLAIAREHVERAEWLLDNVT